MQQATCPEIQPKNIRRQNAKQTLFHMIQKVSRFKALVRSCGWKGNLCEPPVQRDIQETPEGRMQHILLPTWFRKYQKSWLSWGPVVEKGTCAESASRRHNAISHLSRETSKKHPRTKRKTYSLPTWFGKYQNLWLSWGPVVEKGTCAESASRRHNAQATCPEKHPKKPPKTERKTYSYRHDPERYQKLWLSWSPVVEKGTCPESASRRHNAQATCPEKHPRNIRRQNAKHTLTDMIQKVSTIYSSREVLW